MTRPHDDDDDDTDDDDEDADVPEVGGAWDTWGTEVPR
jgi:hypothetical protein